jgi:hypothetical protein
MMLAVTLESCGENVAEWVNDISTWRGGVYVSWPEWVRTQAQSGIDNG